MRSTSAADRNARPRKPSACRLIVLHPIIAEAAGIEQDRLAASPGCDIENTVAEQVALTCLSAARWGDHDRHLPAPWQRIRIVDCEALLHKRSCCWTPAQRVSARISGTLDCSV